MPKMGTIPEGDVAAAIAAHAAIADAHHTQFTQGDISALPESQLDLDQGTQALFDKIAADIATHAAIADAHHTRYTDAEADARADTKVAAHAALPTVHQDAPALIATHAAVLDAHTKNVHGLLRIGEYFVTFPSGGSGTVKTLTASRMRAYPFPITRALTIDRLAIDVSLADAGTKARLGIYNDGDNIYPGSLLLDAGEVDTGTTGVKAIIVSQALAKGLYWVVIVPDGEPKVKTILNLSDPLGVKVTDFNNPKFSWYTDITYGLLPDPFPSGAGYSSTSGLPYILVLPRLASLD